VDDNDVGPDEPDGALVDLTGTPLAELISSDETVLAEALRRLLAEMDQPQEIIAAFQSYVR
jgi:FXSXX-COOH protein